MSAKFVNSYLPLIVGRFITGIVCGCFTGLGPMYLSEIAPKTLRGAAGTLHQLAIVVGITSTNILGLPQILGSADLWHFLFVITILPAIVHFIGMPFCPETPKYTYIKHHDKNLTLKSKEEIEIH